jgi:hypothetical protein
MIVVLFVPVANNISFSWLLQLDAAVAAILALIAIFLYKKRSLQIKFANAVLGLLVLAYIIIFVFNVGLPVDFSTLQRELQFTFCFPFVAGIFDYLAIKGIRHDEKLIRSADRLR